MEITLPNGEPFVLTFPVYVLMRTGPGGKLYLAALALPLELAVMLYTDDDLARRGIENQQLGDMTPLQISTAEGLQKIVMDYAYRGNAVNVAIDVCTQREKPGGFVVPVAAVLGN